MSRTVNLKLTGRAAHGQDDIEVVTDYSLQSREYYLSEIEAEEQFIATHPEHPDRFAAQANIEYCQECLVKLYEQTDAERLANEVESCIHMTELSPQSEYWQNRLAAALVEEYEYHHGDPLEQRKREWSAFLTRMNAPEMVGRRGTVLTPHGWRKQ